MLIAMAGLKGSGKDTVAEVLTGEFGFTKIAFAEAIREMLLVLDPYVVFDTGSVVRLSQLVTQFGWDKIKRDIPEVRRLMQTFGTELGRALLGEHVWINILTKRFPDISDPEARYVITDCRFDNEVQFVHDHSGDVCWVERPGLDSDGHASESRSIKQKADYLFNNDEDIAELQEDVRFFMYLKNVNPI